jgi:cyclic pyranopterin phosphate synthase
MMIDPHQRKISYLRLSITDVCNFKCQYCLPDGYHSNNKTDFLNLDEIRRITTAFAELGAFKIRITGGEPTVRKDFLKVIETVAAVNDVTQIALTSNGFSLHKNAGQWQRAGVNRINISVDSLKPEMFKQITGMDMLPQVLNGVEAALQENYDQVKVNAVLHRGLNNDEATFQSFVDLTKESALSACFIEMMRTNDNEDYFKRYHSSAEGLKNFLTGSGWKPIERKTAAGPSTVYKHPDHLGDMGIISAYSPDFCKNCNRLRVSATGNLHLCLFGSYGVPLRSLLQADEQKEELKAAILKHLGEKLPAHFLHENNSGTTPHLASIGG